MLREKQSKETKSLIPAPALAVLSLFVPGLGQAFAKKVGRGFLLLSSFLTIVSIFYWRIYLLAHREVGILAQYIKALDRRFFFIAILTVMIIGIWVWNIIDAYRLGKKGKKGIGIFGLVLFSLFILGWQIAEIDVYRAATEFPDAWPPLSKVLWPWEAAIDYEAEIMDAGAQILDGCEGELPPVPEEEPGEPYIRVEPRCGNLAEMANDGTITPGTELTIEGKNFEPNTRTEIWWVDPIGNEFRPRQDGEYLSLMTDENGEFTMEMTMPYRLIPPSASGEQIHHVEARQTSQVGPPLPSEPLILTIQRMIETIFMGMMATVFGIIFSIPISFLAARNLMEASPVTLAIYYLTRTILNIIRSIEPLIWALIAVVWVGLGPFAGIIALTIHSIAALGKLYSEAIEGIDDGPIEAIRATGANGIQTIMFAVIPQMIPPFVSFSIYRWDINVRMSTIIGLVGGGGIGFLLVQYIRLLDYRSAGIAVWFIAITVAILDYVSAEIRRRFV
ncbi:MAG: phosphonate ABC transporter, permease protein PhnE [Spirochaetia bacterium]